MKYTKFLKSSVLTLVFLLIHNLMNAQKKIEGSVAAITKITPKKGSEKEVLDAAKYIQKEASTESGCLLFSLNTEKEHPNIVVLYEIFKNQDALDHHKKQQHTEHFSEMLKGKFEKNDVTFLQNIETLHY